MSNPGRIALVQPRIPDGNYLPNLGIMYLAGILLRQGHDVRIFDQNIHGDVASDIVEFDPAIVGIGCVTAALGSAVRLARELKKSLSDVITAVGGPHPTAVPAETLTDNEVIDYAFVGEAERSFPEFCRLVLAEPTDHDAISTMPGLAFRRRGKPVVNRPAGFLTEEELDALPLPPWHLLPMERIFGQQQHGLFSMGKRIMPVMTSRGCPNYCTFCSRVMGFKFRGRSIENVCAEIKWLYETYRVDEIYFEDDTFTQDPERAHRLLDAIIEMNLGIHIKFANGLRADMVDQALLEKMKQAGAYWIGFGIESGSPRTQELMMKRCDLDLAAKNVRLAKRMGFKVGSNCIIGYPGETKRDITESVRYFLDLPLDSFAIVACVPFPGTTAWMICDREGWLTARARDYDNYWFEIFKVSPLVQTPFLSSRDMAAAIRRVYVRFYLLSPRHFVLLGKALLR
ncbi:MAG: radical SAM protein, partial [Planctomycetota bacterium]